MPITAITIREITPPPTEAIVTHMSHSCNMLYVLSADGEAYEVQVTTRRQNEGQPLAAVDLGSNSFRLLIAREEGRQIVPISTHREGVRLAAGLDRDGALSRQKIDEACEALTRFRERLASIPAERVRAVATSTYRVATNRDSLLRASIDALGLPIDIISGPEEARLIYLGCAHTLPWSEQERLIVDIGGGSTEFIVGRRYEPELTESFQLGAVTLSQHFFPGATVTAGAFRRAEVFVRSRLEVLHARYKQGWEVAYGSSGTIRAIYEIITENGFGQNVNVDSMLRLKSALIDAGQMNRIELSALKSSRAPVLPGGLAILLGLMQELNVATMEPSEGALRLGVVHDMLHRSEAPTSDDPRAITVQRLQRRYGVDIEQAQRVNALAQIFWQRVDSKDHSAPDALLTWAASIHEIGMAIAHVDYHRHSAYVIEHSDIYGFSEQERHALASLVFGHTGSLKKLDRATLSHKQIARLMCIRLAALFCHGRVEQSPAATLSANNDSFQLRVSPAWLAERPLTSFLLEEEVSRWAKFGVVFDLEYR